MKFPGKEVFNCESKRTQHYLHNHYPKFEKHLLSKYDFVDKWPEKMYCYYSGIHSHPVCPSCGTPLGFISCNKGYHKFCSIKCASNSNKVINKRKQTNLERYGVEHVSQSLSIKNKTKQTNLERYGTECSFQAESIKEKTKHTCLERYGVEYIGQSESVKEKIQKSIFNSYGGFGYASKKISKKIKQTCLEKYGDKNFNNIEKARDTNLMKYNAPCSLQNLNVRKKCIQVCLEKYGGVGYGSNIINEKIKRTCLEKYGVKNPAQSSLIIDKINKTKRKNHSFNTSKVEEEFALYLDKYNIIYKRQYNSVLYPFNCDFYLPNYDLYIEIQASWTHGGHPYNKEDEETDGAQLRSWLSRCSKYYDNAADVWIRRDPIKRKTAKENKLNYLEIFSNDINIIINQFEIYIKNYASSQ